MTDNQSNKICEVLPEPLIKPARRYELDWLRVLVILNLIPFHTAWAMTCVPGFSQISQDGVGASVLRLYVLFASYWQMSLLFFVAGVAAHMSLSTRSTSEYFRERAKRLLIPLVFYMIFFHPIISCFRPDLSQPHGLLDYLLHFWPECLRTIHARPSLQSSNPTPGWDHLWFVAYLFIFSIIALPLFLYLNRRQKNTLAAVTHFFIANHRIFLLAVPLVVIFAALTPIWPFSQNNLYTDWAGFCYNFTVFLFGYIFCMEERFWWAIDRYTGISLLLGIASFMLVVAMVFCSPAFLTPSYSVPYMLYSLIFGFNNLFWMVAILGLGKRYLSCANDLLRYCSRASYPFYILHFVLIAIPGHFIVQCRMGVFTEFIVISLLSFILALIVYEFFVRRAKVTRFLFGMKA
ncbi:MAG: acyltransferase [Planctomycetes bacterium]|nr:acyltransferase [Planctomycetota bacterium]